MLSAPTGECRGKRDHGRERVGKIDMASLKENAGTAKDDTKAAGRKCTTAKESATEKDEEKRGVGTQRGPRDTRSANGGESRNLQMQLRQRRQNSGERRDERIENGVDLNKKHDGLSTTAGSHPVTVGIDHTLEHAPDRRTRKQN